MYEVFPQLKQPDSDDAPLWRYMSLANLVALLVERYLFFSRLDCLEDPLEGAPSLMVAGVMQRANRIPPPWPNAEGEATFNRWREIMQTCRRRIRVNCWHMSNHESEAMWKLYGRLGENVAVVSNLALLRECFSESPTIVTGALVEYQDDMHHGGSSEIDRDNLYKWASLKRASYDYEREFRLIYLQDDDPTSTESGTYFAVDPRKFVKEVVLSPLMPRWQVLTLHKLIYKLEYELPIRESDLLWRPY